MSTRLTSHEHDDGTGVVTPVKASIYGTTVGRSSATIRGRICACVAKPWTLPDTRLSSRSTLHTPESVVTRSPSCQSMWIAERLRQPGRDRTRAVTRIGSAPRMEGCSNSRVNLGTAGNLKSRGPSPSGSA